MSKYSGKYDLEERTAKFGEDIIKFCKSFKPLVPKVPFGNENRK